MINKRFRFLFLYLQNMSAMISLNSLKNDNKSEISQNVNINVNNNNKDSQGDIKVSYSDPRSTSTNGCSKWNETNNNKIFDYYNNILPNLNNEFYNNIIQIFTYYIDILNEGRFKKLHGQNVLFKKDYLKIIELLTKTYITNNEDCNIKMYVDENIGCFANDWVIDSISCSYKGGFIDIFTKSAEIVNILQMMKIDKQRIINQ